MKNYRRAKIGSCFFLLYLEIYNENLSKSYNKHVPNLPSYNTCHTVLDQNSRHLLNDMAIIDWD